MPSLSHRSSLLFRRHSSTSLATDSETDTHQVASPSKVDPFQSTPSYPLPTVKEGPERPERPTRPDQPTLPTATRKSKTTGVSRKQTLLESKSTPTPKIVLASPSTSTIHYLFPGDNSSSHLSAIPFESRLPRYTGSSSGSDASRKRLSRKSLGEIYDYAPVIESGSSKRLSKSTPRGAPKHAPKDSLDYTKGLKTRSDLPIDWKTNGLKDLGRGHAWTQVTPTTITVLGPTKRVPSLGNEPAKRESIGTRLKAATTAPHAPTSVSLRTISPVSPVNGIIKKAQSMRTLRRQPSLADLGRKVKKDTRMPPLEERENHLEMPKPLLPESGRKRSQSLSSERQSHVPRPILTAPTTPAVPAPLSPVLPPPDLGDPLMVTLPQSPSFSHLDYSTAGSSAPSRHRVTPSFSRTSRLATYPSRNPDPIFTNRDARSPHRGQAPISAEMSRGTTRQGHGGYERPKQVAKDDLEKRLAARDEQRERTLEKLTRGSSEASEPTRVRRFSLRRSQSLKRASQTKDIGRARSQSLSAKSVRQMGISSPVPLPGTEKKERPMSEAGRGIYLGDLNVDLGGRFLLEASLFPGNDGKSPQSSLYPDTTPSSGYSSLPHSSDPESSFPNTANPPQTEFPYRHSKMERRDSIRSEKYRGRPLHPAFASSTSLLAPSTLSLGFSPIATPVSLPESLMDEAIDLTGGWGYKPAKKRGSVEDGTTTLGALHPPTEKGAGPSTSTQFFLPPLYPNSLRMSKSLGPGVLRDSFFAKADPPLRPARSPSRGPPTPKEERSNPLAISQHTEPASPVRRTPRTPKGVGRMGPMPSSFSLCSPPDAIDPLPPLHPQSARLLRTAKSNVFLSASVSLRGLFKRDKQDPADGTIGSRATSASTCFTGMSSPVEPGIKFRGRIISGPMDFDPPTTESSTSKSYGGLGNRPRKPWTPGTFQEQGDQEENLARRERILRAALSQSLRGRRDTTPVSPRTDDEVRGMVASDSRSRMAIPSALLAAAPIDDEEQGEEQGEEMAHASQVVSIASPVQLEPSPDLCVDPVSPPRHRPLSPQISKWSPSPIKHKRRRLKAFVGSPSIPSLSLPLHTARSMISLHKAKDSITLSFSKDPGDPSSVKIPVDGDERWNDEHGSLKVVYESPRRSLSAEREHQAIAQNLGSSGQSSPRLTDADVLTSPPPRPGTPRRMRGSTLPSGLSLTPRSHRTRNPHAALSPAGRSSGSGRWWTSTGLVADKARRFFWAELASEPSRRQIPNARPTGGVSSDDPPVRKVLEELIQREEEERARVEAQGIDDELLEDHQDYHGHQEYHDEDEDRQEDGGSSREEEEVPNIKRQSRSLSRSSSRADRTRKVLDWCEAVDGTKDLREMEERWRMHVEKERERLRRIGERKE